ncbi:hypothetical protein Tco_0414315 [Tanacetum coccineum]
MLSRKRVAKIRHQCWHRVIRSVEHPNQEIIDTNLTVKLHPLLCSKSAIHVSRVRKQFQLRSRSDNSLSGIRLRILSTVDAVELLFGKFTSRDGESLKSYYSWFYKMMNELVRNQCHVTNHQVNVQSASTYIQEWQRNNLQPTITTTFDFIQITSLSNQDSSQESTEELEEAGVQLNAEQADWKDDTDDESEEQELEAHYMYMAQIQELSRSVDNSGINL